MSKDRTSTLVRRRVEIQTLSEGIAELQRRGPSDSISCRGSLRTYVWQTQCTSRIWKELGDSARGSARSPSHCGFLGGGRVHKWVIDSQSLITFCFAGHGYRHHLDPMKAPLGMRKHSMIPYPPVKVGGSFLTCVTCSGLFCGVQPEARGASSAVTVSKPVLVSDPPEARSPVSLKAITDPHTGKATFSFDGREDPPVIRANPGEDIHLTYTNAMSMHSQEHCVDGPCMNMMNLHFHGLHVSPDAPQDDVITMMAMPGQLLHYTVKIPLDQASYKPVSPELIASTENSPSDFVVTLTEGKNGFYINGKKYRPSDTP